MAVNGKQNLVEQVYVVRASQSHWDSNDHFNDLEAVISQDLADQLKEYQSLMPGLRSEMMRRLSTLSQALQTTTPPTDIPVPINLTQNI
jgi:hypothetical protein